MYEQGGMGQYIDHPTSDQYYLQTLVWHYVRPTQLLVEHDQTLINYSYDVHFKHTSVIVDVTDALDDNVLDSSC